MGTILNTNSVKRQGADKGGRACGRKQYVVVET